MLKTATKFANNFWRSFVRNRTLLKRLIDLEKLRGNKGQQW